MNRLKVTIVCLIAVIMTAFFVGCGNVITTTTIVDGKISGKQYKPEEMYHQYSFIHDHPKLVYNSAEYNTFVTYDGLKLKINDEEIYKNKKAGESIKVKLVEIKDEETGESIRRDLERYE